VQVVVIKPVLLAVALLLAAVTGACADPMPQENLNWLKTMAFAAHQTNYSGTFVYQYGGHVETSRITHIVDRDGEHGRLESLDGPRREIVRHNDEVWCDMGSGRVKVALRQGGREFPALLPEQLSLLNNNYLIKPMEEMRLAGFHAHAIVFQPKDNLRYTHKMWADSVSGLLLKSEVLDERGSIVEQYTFTQLSIGGDIDRTWIVVNPLAAGLRANIVQHASQANKVIHEDDLPHDSDQHLARNIPKLAASPIVSGWRVDALPEGFKKIAELRRQLRGRDAPVIQMVFSDGLAGISVFIEKSDGDEDDHSGLSSQGLIQIYSKLVDNQLITVVGEVPPRTVMQVADSVRNGGGN
jgi:sigma-E factor negative regulatory protein RseB